MDHGYDKITQLSVHTQETLPDIISEILQDERYKMFKFDMRIILDLAQDEPHG